MILLDRNLLFVTEPSSTHPRTSYQRLIMNRKIGA